MSGAQPVSHREVVQLPVGYEDPATGDLLREAEVRAVTGGDELAVGLAPEYNRSPNDLVYKTLILARCITRIGGRTNITVHDVKNLHAQDMRVLEYTVFRLTYGEDAVPEPEGPSG